MGDVGLSVQSVPHWHRPPLRPAPGCLHESQVLPGHRDPGPAVCELQHDDGAVLSPVQDPGRLCGGGFLGRR